MSAKCSISLFAAAACLIGCGALLSYAADRYVWSGGDETSNFDSWTHAAKTISNAVNDAADSTIIYVTNDTYMLTARIVITNAITIKGVSRDGVIVDGNNAAGCFDISNAVLDSLTIVNGVNGESPYTGGGILMRNAAATLVTNCVIRNCYADNGGGVYMDGLGAIRNCIVSGNRSGMGGGIETVAGAVVDNCLISSNYSLYPGGGIRINAGCNVANCTIISNTASAGGGACFVGAGSLSNCVVASNTAYINSGGGVLFGGGSGGRVVNCLIAGNEALGSGAGYITNGGGVSCAWSDGNRVESCTIVRNKAGGTGGGLGVYPGYGLSATNCIVFDNQAVDGFNDVDTNSIIIRYSCASDLAHGGNGNTTNDPAFVDAGSGYGTNSVMGNYRLNADSPCVNAGLNQTWMTNSYDLDQLTRIRYGRVDMGAYELIFSGTIYGLH